MASRSGYSRGAVAEYLSGRTLAPTDRFDVLVGLLGANPLEQGALATARDRIEEQRRPRGEPGAVPRQLPPTVPGFTGRARELATLDLLDLRSSPGPDGAVPVAVVSGSAGVGKTALAIQAGHRIAGRYPDGQLFIDLHGYTQGMDPVEPGEALDHLLRAQGIPGAHIPTSLDQRAALYRSQLADQRMLIVLDNAATSAQVAPLLPSSAGSLVLITSRRRLTGLDHTHTLPLDVLPVPDAVELFARTAGDGRLAGEPAEQSQELIELCGRLPLAIRIAAARLRSHPSWRLSHLVARLRDRQHRLGELAAGPRSVTAALDLSYRQLDIDQQRTYRLLGVHPGPDVDPYATAALLDSNLGHAGQMLEQLYEIHLLQEPAPGRFRFHDLTRTHAAGTATGDQPGSEGSMAVDRLLDYYRGTAAAAIDAAYPHGSEHRQQVPPAGSPVPELPDPAAALEWLDIELPNLLAAAPYAADHGRPDYTLDLSSILRRDLLTRGRYDQAAVLHRQALVTARGLGHQPGELAALIGLGHVHLRQSRIETATDQLEQALRIARTIGNRAGELDALAGLGVIHRIQGRHEQAIDQLEQTRRIAHAIGHRAGELDALTGLGVIHRIQGRQERAADHYQAALRIARAIDHQAGEVEPLVGLGHIHRTEGRYEQATEHFAQALHAACAIGHRVGEVAALAGLGRIHRRLGRYQQAAEHYREALRIARAIGHRVGELVALGGLGRIHRFQGRYQQATDYYRQLHDLAREAGDRNFEFEARQGMGRLRHATGDPDAAIRQYRRALALAGELGQPLDEARAHDGLAHAHHALHRREQARRHWQAALDILTDCAVDQTDEEETTAASIRANLTRDAPYAPRSPRRSGKR